MWFVIFSPGLPGPEVELLDKEVPHHTLHLTEAWGEGCGFVSEGFDEAGFILLSEQTEDERLLTRLNDLMSTIHQDAWGKAEKEGQNKSKLVQHDTKQ